MTQINKLQSRSGFLVRGLYIKTRQFCRFLSNRGLVAETDIIRRNSRVMKILMIFQTSPYPADLGPSKRNTPFFLENIKRHEVSILSLGTPEEEAKFRQLYGDACKHIVFVDGRRPKLVSLFLRIGRLLTGRSSLRWMDNADLNKELQKLLRTESFDVIHCCTTLFGYLDLPRHIPLVGDTHNVTFDFAKRTYQQERNPLLKLYYFIDYFFIKKEDIWTTEKLHAVIACTDIDRDKLVPVFPKQRVVTIPNGVDPAFFERPDVREEPNTMVFTGLMSYQPNYQGIMYFLDEIFPHILQQVPDAKVYVVGAQPPKMLQRRAADNIIVTGWVDDVRPYFAKGQVFVIPLLVGGGIRGKALEAMAIRRPIVTTHLGCEGINLVHEHSALFADDPKAFADSVVRLFKDAPLRKKLTEQAYKNVIEGYSWEANGLMLERLYQELRIPHRSNGSSKKREAVQEEYT